MKRYYWEGDNGEYYVIDRYGNPLNSRLDPPTDTYMTRTERRRWAIQKANELNTNPHSEPWDDIQARRDGYIS